MINEVIDITAKVVSDNEPRVSVLLSNPSSLKAISADELWHKLCCTMGKFEFEYWFALKILERSLKAIANGKMFADFSDLAFSNLYIKEDISDKDWILNTKGTNFFNLFVKLPIFEIEEEKENVIILKYIG